MTRVEQLRTSWKTLKTGTLHKSWAVSNPGEASKLDSYVDAIAAGKPATSPALKTATGQALAGLVSLASPRATLPLIGGAG